MVLYLNLQGCGNQYVLFDLTLVLTILPIIMHNSAFCNNWGLCIKNLIWYFSFIQE